VNRLDKCGALGQIRANIRANVYRALLDPHDSGETPKDVKREAPLLLTSVVADFLKSAGMERSRETFLREAGYPKLKDHRDLAATLKCQAVEQAPVNDSVLAQVVESSRAKRGPGATGVSSTQAASKVTGSKSRGVSSDSIDIGAGIGLDRARDTEKTLSKTAYSKPNAVVAATATKPTVAPAVAAQPVPAVTSSSAPEVSIAADSTKSDRIEEPASSKISTQHRTLIVDAAESESPQPSPQRGKLAAIHNPSPSNSASMSECQEFSDSHDISADLNDSSKSGF